MAKGTCRETDVSLSWCVSRQGNGRFCRFWRHETDDRCPTSVSQQSGANFLNGKDTVDILEHGRTLCQKEINEGIFRNLSHFFQKSDKFSRINPLHRTVRARFRDLSVDNFIQRIIRRNFASGIKTLMKWELTKGMRRQDQSEDLPR